ncbi:uncharacterized protein BXIN_2958 [Babesia sp. Xinjiang]|uniref:uncharacterized protein n=1 Tax=Babesia sp. Xinjiang TaxID=462227 RepID=UPI000A22FF88|nr:uncharacterized protein BXIN_2958 [Babesia sp. Xinjiang]ORM39568.1 hypothetical protein BXIN_2958 [Babesia sp. Xinjiang]
MLIRARGANATDWDFDLESLVVMSDRLRQLYGSTEHIQALRLLTDLEPPRHIDSFVVEYEIMLDAFISHAGCLAASDALWVVVWHRSNLHKFELTPQIHRLIAIFRRMMHLHVMKRLVEDVHKRTLLHLDDSQTIYSKTEEEFDRMRKLHSEEISFAQNRVYQLIAQVEVMSKSYYLAETNARVGTMETFITMHQNLKEELERALEENRILCERLASASGT